ncbi:MAG: ABC transporter substrate-binding protein [Chloroflexales bacterium]|nr:ABC transporter substrate-binding protein [Chloroflexales bacterium]
MSLLIGLLAALAAACGGQPASPPAAEATGTPALAPTVAAAAPTAAPEPESTAAPESTSTAPQPTAPATGGASSGPFTIGVSNGFVGSEWRTQMLDDLEKANAEYKAAGLTNDLVIESADTDVQGQTQQIRNLINRGVDAIIINPNSQTGLNSVIKEATDAGIVVIAIDQEIAEPSAVNVVIDQTEWARMSAQWLVDTLGGKGDVVVINGIAGHPANEARYNGVKEVFAANPGINVLNVANANWDQATGQQTMANLLASQPNIDGVWTQDGMALGVLQAIQSANPSEWPVVAGEARAGYMQLWNEVKQSHPDFKSYGVVNPPGIAASGLLVALNLLQGKQLKADVLAGPFSNSLYVPIPGEVSDENFQAEYDKIKDQPASYVLDGIIDQATADGFFE